MCKIKAAFISVIAFCVMPQFLLSASEEWMLQATSLVCRVLTIEPGESDTNIESRLQVLLSSGSSTAETNDISCLAVFYNIRSCHANNLGETARLIDVLGSYTNSVWSDWSSISRIAFLMRNNDRKAALQAVENAITSVNTGRLSSCTSLVLRRIMDWDGTSGNVLDRLMAVKVDVLCDLKRFADARIAAAAINDLALKVAALQQIGEDENIGE
jgi:hypothetical protein